MRRFFITLVSMMLIVTAFAQDENQGTDTALVTSEYTEGTEDIVIGSIDSVHPGDVDDIIRAHDYGNDYRNDTLILLTIGILFIIGGICLLIVTGIMAKNRNRSVLGWLLVGLITTPIVAIIILLILGKNRR